MKIFLIILLAALLLFSCEQEVNDFKVPYKEQLVVSCFIINGTEVQAVIGHTLPVTSEYNFDDFSADDALMIISCEGNDYSFIKQDNFTYTNSELIPETGKKYTMSVKWNGKQAVATTKLPRAVYPDTVYSEIRKLKYGVPGYSWINTIKVKFRPQKDAVYRVGYFAKQPGYTGMIFFLDEIIDLNDAVISPDGVVTKDVFSISGWDSSSVTNSHIWPTHVAINAYDPQYKDYFISSSKADDGFDSFFGLTGERVKWNINGDGIGVFIGITQTMKEINK